MNRKRKPEVPGRQEPAQHDEREAWAGDPKTSLDPYKLAQLRRFAAIPFADKVDWLEQMHRLALRWGARRLP
jgi:hypothetical protein